MKNWIVVALFFLASYAHADCQDTWLEYQSPALRLSVDYSEGCYQGRLIINFQKLSKKGSQSGSQELQATPMAFETECRTQRKGKNGEVIEFSCRKDGRSPLAGATYRYKEYKTTIECDGVIEPDIEHAFVCISGCESAKPKKLHMPWGEGCA